MLTSHVSRMALGGKVNGLGYWIAFGSDGAGPGAFETVGQSRVIAHTMAVNRGSRGVMEAVGMRYVRTFASSWNDPLPGADLGEVEYEMTSAMWTETAAIRPHRAD